MGLKALPEGQCFAKYPIPKRRAVVLGGCVARLRAPSEQQVSKKGTEVKPDRTVEANPGSMTRVSPSVTMTEPE